MWDHVIALEAYSRTTRSGSVGESNAFADSINAA
jgi:hypothetical protein